MLFVVLRVRPNPPRTCVNAGRIGQAALGWLHWVGCIGRVAIVCSRAKESVVDLNEAIRKHARWKTWFQQAVSAGEPLDVAILAKDNQCDLGKWLYGEAQSLYGMRPSHALCLTRHAAIHVEAAKGRRRAPCSMPR